MSDSVRPHRRQPTRLPRPWDSPGKNTGVGCHFLLQCIKMKSESEVTQLCPTLSDPMDCSLPGSSVHGISQARVLEWGVINHNRCTALVGDVGNGESMFWGREYMGKSIPSLQFCCDPKTAILKYAINKKGTSLVVQWLRFHTLNTRCVGSTPGWGN